jgi:hypothetical protein
LVGVPLIFLAGMAVISTHWVFHGSTRSFFMFFGQGTYEIYVLHGVAGFMLARWGVQGNMPLMLLTVWVLPILAAWALYGYQSDRRVPRRA